MPNKLIFIAFFTGLMLLMDWYVFSGFKLLIQNAQPLTQKWLRTGFWTLSVFNIILLLIFHTLPPNMYLGLRVIIITFLFGQYFAKFIWIIFLFIDDIIRFFRWIVSKIQSNKSVETKGGISRSEFIVKTGLMAGTGILTALTWGIVSGAYDYRVKRRTISLKNLPSSFDGLKILQISDIHSGSFWNTEAVKKGVKIIMEQQADVIFFTGDLVNNTADEMVPYMEVFNKIKAPLGVFSVFGNHDYGDYVGWPSIEAKKQNLEDLKTVHKNLGWRLLMNEHERLTRGNDSIGVLGIENWGNKGKFPKYGIMKDAVKGTEDLPVKLLLSHDPSHWRGQVLPEYPDIDVMFAGHTHGMQFGVEIAGIKWSPIKYMYKEWADLYTEGEQHLYVNRGFGFLGYPGRFGILPEITVIELKKG
jgi:predicted MPP superfamily phosphohydrolase